MSKPTTAAAEAPGFVIRKHWTWVAYPAPESEPDPAPEPTTDGETPAAAARWSPNPDYHGFRALILENPNGGEVRAELDARVKLARGEVTEADYLQLIAPRVTAWNALAEDATGTIVAVPAPGEVDDNPEQWQAFHVIEPELMLWLVDEIRQAPAKRRERREG